ncbi:RNA polymerase sigma-70 factor [Streptomyces botrytidirepellens]|uniref:RNA polymerase sigma-70 factor n=1 Tax=Streptomyces botrytidirepellens TaxID=2486417 RepID=A0A3M8UCG0_9ACTN|nr:RNA polymerase sigma-70 factor [Streptomyces botrytidirepellens]RNG03146.1 RNA polymerase sigma-70 factor [Streptomyces botrytidirepellens]
MSKEAAADFEAHRPRLFSLAYRMLGSASEAEDVVQDTYLRWSTADHSAVRTPAAWLTKVMTNLCVNQLTSARAQRELYVGPWLPEPVLTHTGADRLGPLETAEQRESVSFALLSLMERLTPAERAVFVLREAFGHSHREVAEAVGIEEAHSRQLHRRARERLRHPRRDFDVDDAQHQKIVERFFAATFEGDVAGLEQLLADDVVVWADGGGQVTAARRPITGHENVLRYLLGLGSRPETARVRVEFAEVNGAPAAVVFAGQALLAIVVPEIREGRVDAVRTVINPDKLAFAAGQLA